MVTLPARVKTFLTILILVFLRLSSNSESRGFAFVRFYDKRDAGDAIDDLAGKDLDGR